MKLVPRSYRPWLDYRLDAGGSGLLPCWSLSFRMRQPLWRDRSAARLPGLRQPLLLARRSSRLLLRFRDDSGV